MTEHDGERPPAQPRFRSHLHLMSIVLDARNQVICDFSRGCAFGWVTRSVAEQPDFLRLRFLESSVMSLLGAAHLAPIHGALVTRNGVGIALCGNSFAGKSTLAYACARSGWTFVSDDGTFLLRSRADRFAVGNPHSMRFRKDAKALFPELAGFAVALRQNGALAIEVRTSQLPVSTMGGCSIDHLVFLRRSATGRARMNRYEPEEALEWLERASLYGPAEVQKSQRQAYRRLLDAGLSGAALFRPVRSGEHAGSTRRGRMRAVLLTVILAGQAWAQASTGGLIGDVADENSKRLPNTTITVQHATTGFSRSAMTDSQGAYRIEDLLPGKYTITAQHAGYRKVTVSSIAVEVDRKTRLDFTLRPGQESDAVVVEGNSSPVQTDDAAEGYQLGSGVVASLPLSSRNIIELVTLGPGAIPRQLGGFTHDLVNDKQANRGAVALNPPVNGARSTQNRYIVDGADNTDRNTFAVAVLPPLETVEEFRILTSLAPAEFSQGGGAVVDVATKSGGRNFHGNAFEYFQNEAPDAKGFFSVPGLPAGTVRQNQYGATLGGPISKDTFFFASYEGLRGGSANPTQHSVPTAAVRAGDFAGGAQIFDPMSLNAAGLRMPFAGNTIPLTRLDPNVQNYLAKYEPLPNDLANPADDYNDATPNRDHVDNGSLRLDRAWGERNRLFARYTINDERSLLAGSFPELPTSETTRAQQVALGHTYAGAKWIAETHLSFTRLRVFDLPESAFGTNVLASLGVQNAPTDPFTYGLPAIVVTNYDMVQDSDTLPQTQRDNTTYLASSIFADPGSPYLEGLDFQFTHFTMAYLQSLFVRGQYEFNGTYTNDPSNPANTGNPFADFLLSDASETTRDVGTTQAYLRQNGYAAFVQDEWRATSRISVTLGLRYEYNAPYTDDNGTLLNLNYSNLPAAPQLEPVKTGVNPQYLNFSPRVGVAARLIGNTVFRAGYGIYYSDETSVETYDLLRNGVLNQINQPGGSLNALAHAGKRFSSDLFHRSAELLRPRSKRENALRAAVVGESATRRAGPYLDGACLRRHEGNGSGPLPTLQHARAGRNRSGSRAAPRRVSIAGGIPGTRHDLSARTPGQFHLSFAASQRREANVERAGVFNQLRVGEVDRQRRRSDHG